MPYYPPTPSLQPIGVVIGGPAASGSAGATLLKYGSNVVNVNNTTDSIADTFILPINGAGATQIYVVNHTANPIDIFPPAGGAINRRLSGAAFALQEGEAALFVDVEVLPFRLWATFGNSYGGMEQGITAFAGGGQGAATQLSRARSIISVCATANDSVKLPQAALAGDEMYSISNFGVANLAVYPAVGDTIQNLGVNNPLTIAPGARGFLINGGALAGVGRWL